MRINLDSHVSRIDLVGKDAIVIRDGMQVTEFREGILPYALQSNTALCFDEYDAGRPDVMFVIQRVLEVSGKLTLLDQSRVIRPHPAASRIASRPSIRSTCSRSAPPRKPPPPPPRSGRSSARSGNACASSISRTMPARPTSRRGSRSWLSACTPTTTTVTAGQRTSCAK
jgi:hypothetical protein